MRCVRNGDDVCATACRAEGRVVSVRGWIGSWQEAVAHLPDDRLAHLGKPFGYAHRLRSRPTATKEGHCYLSTTTQLSHEQRCAPVVATLTGFLEYNLPK